MLRLWENKNIYYKKRKKERKKDSINILFLCQDYEDYYETEEDINKQLNVFAVNMKVTYGGVNTVSVQTGYPSEAGWWLLMSY